MNSESSRSHLVIGVVIECTNLTNGTVHRGKVLSTAKYHYIKCIICMHDNMQCTDKYMCVSLVLCILKLQLFFITMHE